MNYTVSSFSELHEVLEQFNSGDYLFRGVYDLRYKLVPKIGRPRDKGMDLYEYESSIMKQFRRWAVPFLDKNPQNDWEFLAIAQHHGLPTRLLDWTRNPMVATYFAVNNKHDDDSIVYVIDSSELDSGIDHDPFVYDEEDNEVTVFEPDHITQRIVTQDGLFTVHNNPKLPLEENEDIEIGKIRIKENCRNKVKQTLDFYGVHKASLFPGLDGITEYLEWTGNDLEVKE
jgi:hypothetical protein